MYLYNSKIYTPSGIASEWARKAIAPYGRNFFLFKNFSGMYKERKRQRQAVRLVKTIDVVRRGKKDRKIGEEM